MTEHYYSETPVSESKPITWNFHLRGIPFTFTSDSGVFSKKEVDFGSRLLIEQFEPKNSNNHLLDVGCGYGPIGLSIAKCYPNLQVDMIDLNTRAIELSKRNAENNNINNVDVFQSNLFENVDKEKKYGFILSNPPIRAGKQTVFLIYEEAFARLDDEGELWIVIQKKQGAPSTIEKLESLFAEVEVVTKSKGYYIIRAIKS